MIIDGINGGVIDGDNDLLLSKSSESINISNSHNVIIKNFFFINVSQFKTILGKLRITYIVFRFIWTSWRSK